VYSVVRVYSVMQCKQRLADLIVIYDAS